MKKFVIAGTDTNIGKTLCSALLMSALKGTYFKPIQSGCLEDNDTRTVKELSQLPDAHYLKELYLLKEPLSPHLAAEIDGVEIELNNLTLPENIAFKPLITELAGGLMVPIDRVKKVLYIDVLQKWAQDVNLEVILCARANLGTINHVLLSVEALRSRNIKIAGLVFIGDANPDNIKTAIEFSGLRLLGTIPILEKINKESLLSVFNSSFDKEFFEGCYE